MNRRNLIVATAVTLASALASAGIGGHEAAARKRGRKRGGSAFARAEVTGGAGGRVSVAVNCGSGRASSDAHGMEAVARC